jgi:hypothetical protein
LARQSHHYVVERTRGAKIGMESPYAGSDVLTHAFIDEQLHMCEGRLASDDYDGAITAARSLLEAVLVAIEEDIDGSSEDYGGDLPKLYK